MVLTKDEATKWDIESRAKNDKILHYICFGIILGCHYFIINGHSSYFIPLILSLISIGFDWCSNFVFYHYYEKYKYNEDDIVIPGFSDNWSLVPFACAILSYLVLLMNMFLI